MPCSETKIKANRRNALKSTGPKSPGGKARVALNAVKHGLRAEHLVLPGEDPAAFDAMLADWMGDWEPPTDARRVLVEQAVAHAWRLRRCLRAERAHLLERGRDEARRRRRQARARDLEAVADLGRDPARALRDLLASRAGTEAVLGLWRDLADSAGPDTWDDAEEHHHGLLRLMGLDPDEVDPGSLRGAPDASRWLVEWNEMRQPTRPFQPPPADPEGEAQAQARALAGMLSAFLAERVAETERHLADHFPTDRAEAESEAELALATASAALDDSDEGRALLRYEGQHGREFRATLNQLIKLTQTGIDLAEGEEPEAVETTQIVEEYPVVTENPVAEDRAAGPAAEPAPAAPNKATGGVPTGPEGADEAEDYSPVDPVRVGRAITGYLDRVRSPRLNQ